MANILKAYKEDPPRIDPMIQMLIGIIGVGVISNSIAQMMMDGRLPDQTDTPFEDALGGARTGRVDENRHPIRLVSPTYTATYYSWTHHPVHT